MYAAADDFLCMVRNASGIQTEIQSDSPVVCCEQQRINRAKLNVKVSPGSDVTINIEHGASIQGTFFDRGSDILIIIGPGFGYTRETLQYYARVFHNYDLLIFDYRWRSNFRNFLFSFDTLKSPMGTLFDAPKEEVVAVVRFGRSYKNYKKIIGLGICYSAYQFIAAQAESLENNVQLFDALIIDSCFLSTADVAKHVLRNITLIYDPLQSREPGWIQYLWIMTGISDLLAWLGSKLSNYSAVPLCVQLAQMPILCIHGKADRLVSLEAFEQLWSAIQCPQKMALITPQAHVLNIRTQAIYKSVCDTFIASIS